MKSKGIILITIVVLLFLGFASAYVVDETEQVVITQFGKIVGEPKTDPGLKFRIPFLQKANYFPKNLLQWDGDPGQIPTLDKTFIWVDTFARWKIIDPIKFFQTVNNTTAAQYRLNDIIDPAVRNLITGNRLIETVRATNRQLGSGFGEDELSQPVFFKITTGRQKITEAILKQAQPKLSPFGIEIVDVKIKRVNYVEQVRDSVYNRMIAERQQIAEKFRSEGKGEAQKIRGEKERDLKRINSEAYRTAQELKGKADAEATAIYARAYNADPDFYSFIKTLEIYTDTLDTKSSLIISTDSEFLKYLKGYQAQP
jgi:membrane protease subunit HflC